MCREWQNEPRAPQRCGCSWRGFHHQGRPGRRGSDLGLRRGTCGTAAAHGSRGDEQKHPGVLAPALPALSTGGSGDKRPDRRSGAKSLFPSSQALKNRASTSSGPEASRLQASCFCARWEEIWAKTCVTAEEQTQGRFSSRAHGPAELGGASNPSCGAHPTLNVSSTCLQARSASNSAALSRRKALVSRVPVVCWTGHQRGHLTFCKRGKRR